MTIAGATGLPVGIKSAVGEERFWLDLTERMARTGRGVDFVTVDGGEGGTGAAPLVFSDHVSLPFKWAFPRVFRAFAEQGLDHQVVFVGSGKLEEIADLLGPFDMTVVGAGDLGLPEPEETETTFIGNARLKAHAAARASGLVALADDSGLAVDALNGAPGVFTADWATTSKGRDFAVGMERVWRELEAIRDENLVAIMAALKAVDFFDESRAFHRRMDAAVDSLEEIVRLLEARRDEEGGE